MRIFLNNVKYNSLNKDKLVAKFQAFNGCRLSVASQQITKTERNFSKTGILFTQLAYNEV